MSLHKSAFKQTHYETYIILYGSIYCPTGLTPSLYKYYGFEKHFVLVTGEEGKNFLE